MDRHKGRLRETCPRGDLNHLYGGISSRFSLANHFALPGSESVFGITWGPPTEKTMAPHSSNLAWKIPCTRSLEGCSPWGLWGSDTTETLHFHFHALEKEMATHFSVLAWRIPGMGKPGGLPSMGSHRVRHDWSALAAVEGVLPCVHAHLLAKMESSEKAYW